jgi:hypothetical protein
LQQTLKAFKINILKKISGTSSLIALAGWIESAASHPQGILFARQLSTRLELQILDFYLTALRTASEPDRNFLSDANR